MMDSSDIVSYLSHAIGLLIALLFLLLCKIYIQWRFSPLRKLPGPRGKIFLTGEFFTIFDEPFFSPHLRWWKACDYAPIMSYPSLFGRWCVIPTDPEIIKHILTSPSAKEPVRYYKDFFFFRDFVGEGLVSLEGRSWSKHRRMLQPCFQSRLVKEALAAAVPAKVNDLIESWKKSEGRVIEIYAHMSAITLDILGDVSFGHNFKALDTIKKWANDSRGNEIGAIQDPMMQSLAKIFKPNMVGIALGMLKLGWLQKFTSKRNTTKLLLDKAADDIIQAAKNNSSIKENSLIHMMLQAMSKDNGGEGRNSLTMQELKDELKLFIIAGHETTSTWLYWAFYALAIHPDVQDKVLQDIEKHAGTDDQVGLDSIAKMEYFLAFLNECLRLYSPAGMLFRHTGQNENWDGNVIPKHTRIIIPIFLLHRHPDNWNDGEKFIPERWIENGSVQPKHHPFSFLPFSGGGRNCIGEVFARTEAKLILVNLIRVFQIKLAPSMHDTKLEFRNSLTVKSNPIVQIIVKSR